jgi:hypothetical protein
MDDNIVIFVTIMKVFVTKIVYSTTCTKKYKPHMANIFISIEILSFQCTHPWVLFAIIHGFSMNKYLIANRMLEKAIMT